MLPVQVIGQQWKFTYRYPTYGGFETTELVIPDDTTIAFHVTSLDVIHSFWAYQLGVKADANPAQDNVAFTTTDQLGKFTVRCSELCGIWHGAMYNSGVVVVAGGLPGVGHGHPERAWRPTPSCCRPSPTPTSPTPTAPTAGYYPDNVDPYSKVETYGATPAKPTPKG